jgi:hypothetical protein
MRPCGRVIPYMAPEYAIGRNCSARSNLFSLDVLPHECLSRGVPNHSELELRCGVPHRLGWATEAGSLTVCTFGNRSGVSLVVIL